ncbi:carbohydrate ABC transporter permease [Rhodococcus ruber]|uniref:Carbohydrate ABC transporter permease n=1 Tax=Rhodococcus ruber TaxID=1830 RepID=A0ABT4M9F8_9NOCA|nr:carbohydrate ABC transporter permease [Rhodococcus ruber]MCZ4517603.1 carbohydrate ABC transporter permease [Rhodococcus ruber]
MTVVNRPDTVPPKHVENDGARQRTRRTANLFGYIAMVLVLLMIGLPLFWILITSFKDRPDIYVQPVTWWPSAFHPQNYDQATTQVPFFTYLRNSFVITTAVSSIKFVLGVLSAYGLVFFRFPGKNIVFLVIIAALMVPNQITVISNYSLISDLGWRNSFQGIIIPLAGVAFGTFLMRNHFLSLPSEIIEAARMDGAGPARLMFRVVLPLSGPTMVAFGIITIVNEWNEYLWPFLMSDDSSVAPLPVGLTLLQNSEGYTNWGAVMAATILTILPILLVFLVLQRHMIKGLTSGAVKG